MILNICFIRIKLLVLGKKKNRIRELLYSNFPFSFHPGQAIDAPLSEAGLQQAEAAGRYLADVKFTNVFVSNMLRAKQVNYEPYTTAV